MRVCVPVCLLVTNFYAQYTQRDGNNKYDQLKYTHCIVVHTKLMAAGWLEAKVCTFLVPPQPYSMCSPAEDPSHRLRVSAE